MSHPPERPVQLRNDLDGLYVVVGELQTTVRGIAATQQEHGVRLVRVERAVTELRADVSVVQSDVAGLRSDMSVLQSDVAEMRSDMAEMRGDVTELRRGQDEILQLLRARP